MKKIALWILVSILFTALAGLGLIDRPDAVLSDAMYQSRTLLDENIVLVGIDQRAIRELGPFHSWDRSVLAEAVEYLNKDQDSSPAVIALDILFVGESNPEDDRRLAEAAALGGNVITATSAKFGSDLIVEDKKRFYMDDFSILEYEEPYGALKAVTTPGHINAMLDVDGVFRHHLARITLKDGNEVPSLSMAAARMYREFHGLEEIKAPPVDSRGFWYLNFHGLPGDYNESISIVSLLNGEIPSAYFAGKIVMIGPYAAGLQDSQITSIDHGRAMYGIEIQANAVQSLLEGTYQREAGKTFQLLLLFVIVLLGCAVFWKRPAGPGTVCWLAITAGWILICRIAYDYGIVLHVLWIPACLTTLYMGSILYNYIQAAVERHKITNTFKRYVAPEIVNEILKTGTKSLGLGGKLCNIAVLFVDIRGFTPMSELLEPEQVVEILNRYLTLTSACITRHGGTLDKFIGDAAMAFWGAPLPQEDYVMNAVKAALDMAEGSRTLSCELTERFGRTVTFGIGIHMGTAVVGNIGAENRMDYTAIGDTVNTASRLESQAPAGTIYISGAVAGALAGRIRAVSLGTGIKLKGKSTELEVLVLEGLLSETEA